MKHIFYKNNQASFSYQELIEALRKARSFYSSWSESNYPSFVINVLTALISDNDLILHDYRNAVSESIAEIKRVNTRNIKDSEELINILHNSKSNIGIYSSGTTATPKLISQSVQRLLKSVRISDEYKHSRWAFTYNPSHSAGIQVFLQAICNQATLYDLYKCSRSEIIHTLVEERITHLSATPTFYRMLAPYDFILPEIKSVTFNGEKSTIELIDLIRGVCPNARIRNIYGSTESGPLMSSGSTTFRIPDRLKDHVKIEDEELLIKSELISKSVANEEWYHTGDLVKITSEDPLTVEFVTRKSKVLNVGGQNVSPQEVEEVLISYTGVKDARVYGRPNKMIGNLVVAEIQIHKGITIHEKELINYCKSCLAAYKVPRLIKFVEKIEIGRTGKKL